MLKYIELTALCLGMYIEELCEGGINSPLWGGGFLLQDECELQRIKASTLAGLWINICRGVDVDSLSCDGQRCQSKHAFDSGQDKAFATNLQKEVAHAVVLCGRSKVAVVEMFDDVREGRIVETGKVTGLVADISESLTRHPDALISLVRLKTSDEYTLMHSVAVCALMIALARQLKLPPNLVEEAGVAGFMHDVGKAAMPVEIINKPGKLSEVEFEIMRGHPEAGVKLLRGNPHFTPRVLDVCLHHHEKIDGSGYPHKLAGMQISLFARMAAVCDVYDAITSNRPYKGAWGAADSIHKMSEWQGHFDEIVFQAFIKCVGIYPVGTLVRLESGRLGVVVEQNNGALLSPKVKVFYCIANASYVAQTIVDLAQLVGKERIVGRECPAYWGVENIDEIWSGLAATTTSRFD